MREVTFEIEQDFMDGGYSAGWTDPRRGGIATQGQDLAELDFMIRDAIRCYFNDDEPTVVTLRFMHDPILLVGDPTQICWPEKVTLEIEPPSSDDDLIVSK